MVQLIRPGDRDRGTAQTPGMSREAGICAETTEATGLWMGVGSNAPGAASGAHHHGETESGIYIFSGQIRFRWGAHLEHVVDAAPGDFVFVPPHEVHSEENLSADAPASFVLARNSSEVIVVNVPDPR
ncbi:MAG: cupin domain-containing protein [Chloroflexi bacterium]|nr:MAG: cupin domain-containing protein [Chloroflexota bacterium]